MPGAQYALMSGLLRQSDFLQGRLKLHEEPKPNHSYIGTCKRFSFARGSPSLRAPRLNRVE